MNHLRKHRIEASAKAGSKIRACDVARFYHGGVTEARISQLESAPLVSGRVEREYLRAIVAAVEWRRRLKKVGELVGAEAEEFARAVARESSNAS